jgi:hypothetical protein
LHDGRLHVAMPALFDNDVVAFLLNDPSHLGPVGWIEKRLDQTGHRGRIGQPGELIGCPATDIVKRAVGQLAAECPRLMEFPGG